MDSLSNKAHTQEDEILKEIREEKKEASWNDVSRQFNVRSSSAHRSSRQCRQRWKYHLSAIRHSKPWSKEEKRELFRLHSIFGNRWCQISEQMPPRNKDQIKNEFYASVRKGLRRLCKQGLELKNATDELRDIKPYTVGQIFYSGHEEGEREVEEMSPKLRKEPRGQLDVSELGFVRQVIINKILGEGVESKADIRQAIQLLFKINSAFEEGSQGNMQEPGIVFSSGSQASSHSQEESGDSHQMREEQYEGGIFSRHSSGRSDPSVARRQEDVSYEKNEEWVWQVARREGGTEYELGVSNWGEQMMEIEEEEHVPEPGLFQRILEYSITVKNQPGTDSSLRNPSTSTSLHRKTLEANHTTNLTFSGRGDSFQSDMSLRPCPKLTNISNHNTQDQYLIQVSFAHQSSTLKPQIVSGDTVIEQFFMAFPQFVQIYEYWGDKTRFVLLEREFQYNKCKEKKLREFLPFLQSRSSGNCSKIIIDNKYEASN